MSAPPVPAPIRNSGGMTAHSTCFSNILCWTTLSASQYLSTCQNICKIGPPTYFLWFLKHSSIKSHTTYSLWRACLFHCSCRVRNTCPLADSSSPDSAHSWVHLCFLYSPNSALHVLSFHTTPCQRSTGSKSCYSYMLKRKKHTHTPGYLTLFKLMHNSGA